MQHILVFDIETVVDADAARKLLALPDVTDTQARLALGAHYLEKSKGRHDFARQPFHQVVAISYAQLNQEGAELVLHRIATGGENGSSEKELLQGFFQFVDQYRPQLVSYNGRGFDIPVLKYRAMKHLLSCPAWFNQRYDYRYDQKKHLDLLDVFSDYGASARCSLEEVATCFDVPGKLETSGADVAALFEANRVQDIRNYCECDVLSTLLLFLRWQLFNGQLSFETFSRSSLAVHHYLQQEVVERPHFQSFLDAWQGDKA